MRTRHTLLGVLVTGAVALAGPLLGACSTTSGNPSATTTPQASASHCWVGTWKLQSGTIDITVAGHKVVLTGGAGQVVVISHSGAMAANFDHAEPITGTDAGQPYTVTYSGTERFQLTVDGDLAGSMTQRSLGGGSATVDAGGSGHTQRLTAGNVTHYSFTCDADHLTFHSKSPSITQTFLRQAV